MCTKLTGWQAHSWLESVGRGWPGKLKSSIWQWDLIHQAHPSHVLPDKHCLILISSTLPSRILNGNLLSTFVIVYTYIIFSPSFWSNHGDKKVFRECNSNSLDVILLTIYIYISLSKFMEMVVVLSCIDKINKKEKTWRYLSLPSSRITLQARYSVLNREAVQYSEKIGQEETLTYHQDAYGAPLLQRS